MNETRVFVHNPLQRKTKKSCRRAIHRSFCCH